MFLPIFAYFDPQDKEWIFKYILSKFEKKAEQTEKQLTRDYWMKYFITPMFLYFFKSFFKWYVLSKMLH